MRKDAPVISCFELSLTLGERALLDQLTFEIGRGSWTEIVGTAGVGKTLLFSMLSLRAAIPSGRLVVCGRNLERIGRADIAELRRNLSSCAQSPILLEDRTVIENLVLPFVVRAEPRVACEASEVALEEAEMTHLRDRLICELSSQERLAVGVLRATLGSPQAIIIDAALDAVEPRFHKPLLNLLKARHLEGSAVILFGREFTDNARRGQRFRMEEGKLQDVETPTIVEAPVAAAAAGGAQ